jgi:hypothetical protein
MVENKAYAAATNKIISYLFIKLAATTKGVNTKFILIIQHITQSSTAVTSFHEGLKVITTDL